MRLIIWAADRGQFKENQDGCHPALIPYGGSSYLAPLLGKRGGDSAIIRPDGLFLCVSRKRKKEAEFLTKGTGWSLLFQEETEDRIKQAPEETVILNGRMTGWERTGRGLDDLAGELSQSGAGCGKNGVVFLHGDGEAGPQDWDAVYLPPGARIPEERFRSETPETGRNAPEIREDAPCDLRNSPLSSFLKPATERALLERYPSEPVPGDSIPSAFFAAAKQYADRDAVVCGSRTLTYRELDRASECLARGLRRRIPDAGFRAGIFLPKGIEAICAMLAVLRAGGTYVPMSESYPEERLTDMADIAGMALVIASPERDGTLLGSAAVVSFGHLMEEGRCGGQEEEEPENRFIAPEADAYILFTSGTTGRPKGVRITHQNVLNNAWYLRRHIFRGRNEVRFGVLAELVFDMSVQQIYPALLFGGTLCLPEGKGSKSPDRLCRFLQKVDCSDITPVLLELFTAYLEKKKDRRTGFCPLHLVTGGEVLPIGLAKRYLALSPDFSLTNIYGPTECTVEIAAFEVTAESLQGRMTVPIGTAVGNTRIHLLDGEGKLVPAGKQGEICAAGKSVGAGYLCAEELETDGYRSPPVLGERIYRTGDLGRWGPDGNLEYEGRKDRQIKLRGYRIDLGDVEQNAARVLSPGKVFAAIREENGRKGIALWFDSPVRREASDIRSALEEVLPSYMVPEWLIPVGTFPVTISGKTDAGRLPGPEHAIREETGPAVSGEDAFGETMLQLIRTFSDLPDHAPVPDVPLAKIGCNSLRMLELITGIYEEFGVEPDLSEAFGKISAGALIRLIREKKERREKTEAAAAKERARRRTAQMLPMQRYCVYLEHVTGRAEFNQMVYLWRMKPGTDPERLREAVERTVAKNDAFRIRPMGDRRLILDHETGVRVTVTRAENAGESASDLVSEARALRMTDPVLARFRIVAGPSRCYLAARVHHLVFDYLSAVFLIGQIEREYAGRRTQGSSFWNYILRCGTECRDRSGTDSDGWVRPEVIPLNVRRSENAGMQSSRMTLRPEQMAFLRSGALKRLHVSMFLLLFLGMFRILLNLSGQEKLSVATFLNGRRRAIPVSSVGFFARYIPVTLGGDFHQPERRLRELADIWEKQNREGDRSDIHQILSGDALPNVLFDVQDMEPEADSGVRLWDRMQAFEKNDLSEDLILRIVQRSSGWEIETGISSDFAETYNLQAEQFAEDYLGNLRSLFTELEQNTGTGKELLL